MTIPAAARIMLLSVRSLPAASEASSELALSELDLVLRSVCFRRSFRLCKLLKYLVEHTTAGALGKLTEHAIGTACLGLPESFEEQKSANVRVEMHRLRAKLDEYYETEGRNDAVEIAFPPWQFVAVIRTRHAAGPRNQRASSIAVVMSAAPDRTLAADRRARELASGLAHALIEFRTDPLRVFLWSPRSSGELRDLMRQTQVDVLLEIQMRRGPACIQMGLTRACDGALLWSHRFAKPDTGRVGLRRLPATVAAMVYRTLAVSAGVDQD